MDTMESEYPIHQLTPTKIVPPSNDIIKGKEKERQYFNRGYRLTSSNNNGTTQTASGSISRLTTIIRRSLRIKSRPKPSTTDNLENSPKKRMTFRKAFDDKEGSSFTDYSSVRIHKCKEDYGRLEQLEQYIRQNKINDIKKFVRINNWPASHEIRCHLWATLSKDKNFDLNKSLYKSKMDEFRTKNCQLIQPKFLSLDGVIINDHGLKECGVVALQKFLIMVEEDRPDVTFIPALYSFSALLLHYVQPDEAFAIISKMLSVEKKFLIQSEVMYEASPYVLLQLIKTHKKKVYVYLEKCCKSNNRDDLVKPLKKWYEWIFRYMPFDYIVRVTDCFIVEGHKFLLRIGISIVYLWYKDRSRSIHLKSVPNKSKEECLEEVENQLIEVCKSIPVSCQTFIDVATHIRNMKQSFINKNQKYYEDLIRQDITLNRSTKADYSIKHMHHLFSSVFSSKIVTPDCAEALMRAIPERLQLETPILIFTLSEQGISFVNFWNKIDEAEQSLIIIKTMKGDIFGGYASSSWSERKDLKERQRSKFFGTGESFVFKVDENSKLPIIYDWVGNHWDQSDDPPQMFMAAGDRFLILGSGNNTSIEIRDELSKGVTYECSTFGSPPLVQERTFDIQEMEVFHVHSECAPMVVSRALGLAITAGSMMLLLPQILKIFAAKSGRGISLISQFLALLASSGTAAYSFKSGFVFSQWGDSLFVSLQTAVIIMQILYYSPRRPYAFAFLAFVWSGYLAIVGDYVPFHVLTTIQTLTIPITVISKGIQIIENFQNKSTGELSLISVGLAFGGCLARIFTSIQETGDSLIIMSYVIAGILNGIIFGQFFTYWSNKLKKD
ncbi:MIP14691p [Strongyloides ratti]|uniref:Mannose-P-dolichol utilization defect 1 protein homolog n=1 Tax=Strongyloides ratti TaxID=34506 RepID=A0A090L5C5_STRRB|nr:MIP14691p [Strongyloides ratti]CEF62674.1 MIP14691p [Strongyloides ratti]